MAESFSNHRMCIGIWFNKIYKRMYVISVLISAKFYDDRFFQNVYYANVAGISHEEFNMLERKYLFLLDFKLLIDPAIFFAYRDKILTHYLDETEWLIKCVWVIIFLFH